MRTWSVTARGMAAVQVQGRNWIVALGRGLEELGRVPDLTRLACEVLPNGTVIARDIATGTGYIVQTLEEGSGARAVTSLPPDAISPLEPEAAVAADDAIGSHGDLAPPPPRSSASEGRFPLPARPRRPSLAPAPAEDEEAHGFALGDDADGDDTAAEPIFELPADAIDELTADESPMDAIQGAETTAGACQRALDAARIKIPAESGAVILEERGYLRFLAVNGPASRKLVGVRLPLGTGAAGFAMEKRRTVVLANAHEDPRHCGEVDALTGYVTREICVVPVLHGDRVLGVLELMNLPGGRRFADREIEVMTEIARVLAERLAH